MVRESKIAKFWECKKLSQQFGDSQNLWSKIDKIIPKILKIRKIYHEREGEKGRMKFNLFDLRSECEILETERRAKS